MSSAYHVHKMDGMHLAAPVVCLICQRRLSGDYIYTL